MAAWYEDGRIRFAVGFEDTFIPQVRLGERPLDEYELTDHYTQWPHDLNLLRESGAEQARWGIPWYRINPEPGRWRFDWLDQVIDKFDEIGVEPIIDLMHYGTPTWLDNEFLNIDYPARVAEYAAAVADRYQSRLRLYTPMNEPLLNAMFCGELGYWPPYLRGDDGFVRIVLALAKGICATQAAIRDVVSDDVTFVHVEASFRFTGDEAEHGERMRFLRQRAFLVEDLVTGRVDGKHPMAGYLSRWGVDDADLAWFSDNPAEPDVMGVNYYPQVSTTLMPKGEHHSGTPFEDEWPRVNDGVTGLADVLRTWAEHVGRPVYLTETSWPGTVDERVAWLDQSVACVEQLRQEGIPIVGFCWWSLFDMMFWSYRHEQRPREDYLAGMGLWDLIPDDVGVLRRQRTAAADAFRDHALRARAGGRH